MPRPNPTIAAAARPGPRVPSPERSLAAYLWAAPCTAIGMALGLTALLCGARWQRHAGVLEVARPDAAPARPSMLPFVAITFGHVVLGRSTGDLERLRAHEHAHVAQYERWGPLFLLAYPLASLLALLRSGRPHYDNCFEVEARAAARRPAAPEGGLNQG
jgi:hypothetical protein